MSSFPASIICTVALLSWAGCLSMVLLRLRALSCGFGRDRLVFHSMQMKNPEVDWFTRLHRKRHSHLFQTKGGRWGFSPLQSLPGLYHLKWQFPLGQRRQHRWRWGLCPRWQCKRPSPESSLQACKLKHSVRSSLRPFGSPSQQGRGSGRG